jgi:hypothetical protein
MPLLDLNFITKAFWRCELEKKMVINRAIYPIIILPYLL